jgi:3-hydroxyacyl-CoA dehydrogenase / enoyl-CoA hydratase / 3-hydroxybutyryl-CoA epimerase
VQHRLLFAQVLEAVRALEEGVLTDIREGDVGAILGWGFAPWSGGPFSWLDMIGATKAVEICRGLTAQFGPRFHTPALLREMADKGALAGGPPPLALPFVSEPVRQKWNPVLAKDRRKKRN